MDNYLQGQPDIDDFASGYKNDPITKSIQTEILKRQKHMLVAVGRTDDSSAIYVSPRIIDVLDSQGIIETESMVLVSEGLEKALSEDLLKARDRSHLVQKTITDKKGRKRKVWVKPKQGDIDSSGTAKVGKRVESGWGKKKEPKADVESVGKQLDAAFKDAQQNDPGDFVDSLSSLADNPKIKNEDLADALAEQDVAEIKKELKNSSPEEVKMLSDALSKLSGGGESKADNPMGIDMAANE